MSTHSLVESVNDFLRQNYIYTDSDWLTGCVQYLLQDTNSKYTEQEIKKLAKEQWLLNDLRDICPGSLPADLNKAKKTTLNGNHILQVDSVLDISKPAYQQYLNIRKVNIENIEATANNEEKTVYRRMLKLHLTDGNQDISGIERKPMRNLSCNLTPGSKILIKGPVECREGVLFLYEHSIELLGGEVNEIVTSNSYIAVLAKKLNISHIEDLNIGSDNPILSNDSAHITNMQTAISTASVTQNAVCHTTEIPHTTSHTISRTVSRDHTNEQQSRPVARVKSLQVVNDFPDDDIDIDQIAAIEAKIFANNVVTIEDSPRPSKKARLKSPIKESNIETTDNSDVIMINDDSLSGIELRQNKTENSFEDLEAPISESESYINLKKINEMDRTLTNGQVFRIKARILRLLSKLSPKHGKWCLNCTLTDDTGTLDVSFSSDVLSKLLGYTPQEMAVIKKDIAAKPELKDVMYNKIVTALDKARETLKALDGMMELTMSETPQITNLIDI